PAVGRAHAADGVEERRLAGARAPDERDELARQDREGDVVQERAPALDRLAEVEAVDADGAVLAAADQQPVLVDQAEGPEGERRAAADLDRALHLLAVDEAAVGAVEVLDEQRAGG